MGLGSIVGTGVFVSLGLAAGIAGSSMLLALALAALVASLNGLSSAQLAAAHPVSGGTYEYGHRFLGPASGFAAGWVFLCAKTASAASAALGFAGYVLALVGADPHELGPRLGLAALAVVLVTGLCVLGVRRTSAANALIVGATLAALALFVAGGVPTALASRQVTLDAVLSIGPRAGTSWPELLHATALLFVAYTGYGRIATLGEEVREPSRTIPRAVVLTLALVLALYALVAWTALAAVGPERFAAATSEQAAPLEVVARAFDSPLFGGIDASRVASVVAFGAVTAMLGVLLNLVLGLSRVWLAMGRRGEMPTALADLDARTGAPRLAVLVTGASILALTLVGQVRTTWSFSAFTVLVYYAITNLAALRLPVALRRYPRVVPALGLVACLGLAFWVEPAVWLSGLAIMGVGMLWRLAARRLSGRSRAV
jgi:APA family basic amino acid/polyamine antiporter